MAVKEAGPHPLPAAMVPHQVHNKTATEIDLAEVMPTGRTLVLSGFVMIFCGSAGQGCGFFISEHNLKRDVQAGLTTKYTKTGTP